MKKILFALLLLPLCSRAQLEIGANDGLAFFTLVGGNNPTSGKTVGPHNNYDLNISYRLRHFRVGVGYNGTTFKYSDRSEAASYTFTIPTSNIYVAGEYLTTFGRSSFYTGLSLGCIKGTNKMQNIDSAARYPDFTSTSKATGFSGGARIGYSYDVWKGISLNVAVSAIYMTYWSDITTTFNVICFPVTAGVHYTLPFHKKAPQETPAAQVIKGM